MQQAKVLRVLQEKKLSRVGSDKDIEVDVRVIAATNKNLREEIAKGNIRELRNVVERLLILGDTEISDQNVKDYVM